jgi:hypothetical protein
VSRDDRAGDRADRARSSSCGHPKLVPLFNESGKLVPTSHRWGHSESPVFGPGFLRCFSCIQPTPARKRPSAAHRYARALPAHSRRASPDGLARACGHGRSANIPRLTLALVSGPTAVSPDQSPSTGRPPRRTPRGRDTQARPDSTWDHRESRQANKRPPRRGYWTP